MLQSSLAAKYGGVVDSHATSNLAISDEKRRKKRIKTESLSIITRFDVIYKHNKMFGFWFD